MKPRSKILLIIFVLALVSLACNYSLHGPITPEPTIPVTTQAVEDLEQNLNNAADEAAKTGRINLTITENQMTSLLAQQLEQAGVDFLTNPQVTLRDGQIQLTGDVNQDDLSAKVTVILTVSVDAAGRPMLDVVSANIGPLPVPEDLLSEVQTRLNEAFLGQIRSVAPNLFVESIVIEGGSMTITGRTQ